MTPPVPAEEPLGAGHMGGAVRVGDTVRRPPGPWTPTVQRLLRCLRDHGLGWVPEPLGTDEAGRDVVSFLPGDVPQYPLPDRVWADDVLVAAARLAAELHDATAGLDLRDAVWRLPVHEPAEVVCHNDLAPYNMVFTDGRLTGVVDWDTASPGPRVWDLAYLAYRLVPLTDPADDDAPATPAPERARRLRLLCHEYGDDVEPADVVATAVPRLEELAALTARHASQGHDDLHAHVDLYLRDARWVAHHATDLHAPTTEA